MLRRLVSIKLLQLGGEVDEQGFVSAVERFHREARAVAALDHPNIVRSSTSTASAAIPSW